MNNRSERSLNSSVNKVIRKIILYFSFVLIFAISFSSMFNNVIYAQSNVEFENSEINNSNSISLTSTSGYNEFTGSYRTMSIGSTVGNVFNYQGMKNYFYYKGSSTQFIDLNYVGPDASLKIYSKYYYSSNDYVYYSSNISNDIEIIYIGLNQEYIFEFTNLESGLSSMTITPQVVSTTLSEHEKYLLHIEYDANSSLGFHYDVEYFNIDLDDCEETTEYINSSNGTTNYLDLISDNLNFNVSNDNRRLVSNPGECQYSAIAYASTEANYIIGNTMIRNGYRGSGTFVDETTVVSCAHLLYNDYEDTAGNIIASTLSRNLKFYPGANSYYDSTNFNKTFGTYEATDSYVPISYILFHSDRKDRSYDWSISLTQNTVIGTSTHSYMRLFPFDSSTSNQIQSAGYPALKTYPNYNKYQYTMWASYPLYNEITKSGNTLISTEIVSTGGNSGGPLFVYNTGIQNGQVFRYSYQIGILTASSHKDGAFIKSYSCKIRPVIINTYYAITS